MATVLKHSKKDLYIKSYNKLEGKVEFTDIPSEAKRYSTDWFAESEKNQLQFYSSKPYNEGGLIGDHLDEIAEFTSVII